MPIQVKLSERHWDLVLQSIGHRRMQTENPELKAKLQDLEKRIDAQLRER